MAGDLKDLLKDPRSLATVRYLRKIDPDPITGKEWVIIKDPVKGIIGVASSSDAEPLKQAGFPEEYKLFEKKTKYSEWQFVYNPAQQSGSVRQQSVQLPKSPFLP